MNFETAKLNFTTEGIDANILTSYSNFEWDQNKESQRNNHLYSLSISQNRPTKETEIIGNFEDENSQIVVSSFPQGYLIESYLPSQSQPFMTLECNDDFSQGKLYIIDSNYRKTAINNSAMMLYAFTSALHNTLLLHSSVIVHQGKGYLFLGKSGTGKSTHSQLWLNHIEGTHLLNDDNPVLRIIDNQPWVFGSPWSGKTPCYRNEAYPVGGIVRLWQRPENSIRKLRPTEAFAALLPTASSLPCVPNIQQAVHETIQQVAEIVPVYSLGCLPNAEATLSCHTTITKQ